MQWKKICPMDSSTSSHRTHSGETARLAAETLPIQRTHQNTSQMPRYWDRSSYTHIHSKKVMRSVCLQILMFSIPTQSPDTPEEHWYSITLTQNKTWTHFEAGRNFRGLLWADWPVTSAYTSSWVPQKSINDKNYSNKTSRKSRVQLRSKRTRSGKNSRQQTKKSLLIIICQMWHNIETGHLS